MFCGKYDIIDILKNGGVVMDRETQIKILMKDRCTKSEAENILKIG